MNKIELEDFLKYQFISGLSLSKDNKLLFVISKASENKNGYDQNIYMYDGTLKQLTQSNKVNNFCLLDNDNIIYEEKSNDNYLHFNYLNLKTNIISRGFTLPLFNAEIKKIDENHIAILSVIKKEYPNLYKSDNYLELTKEIKENKDYEILDENPYWFNGQGFTNGNRTALFLMDINDKSTLKRVSSPLMDIKKIEVFNGQIYALADEYSNKPNDYLKIYKLNNEKFETLIESDLIHFNDFYFNGNDLLIFGSDQKTWGINENDNIYIYNDGKLDLYYKNEESFGSSVGSDCRFGKTRSIQSYNNELFYTSTRFNGSYLFKLNEGKEEKISLNLEGSIDDFVVGDNFIYFVGMLDNKLEEIYKIDLNSKRQEQLTFINKDVLKDKYIAEYEDVRCTSHDTEIYGWVLKPKDFDKTKKYPAILDVHGGPKTVYGKVFYHEMQYWANNGYFVLFCNPIGGDGRGNKFMYMSGRFGTDDYDSLMEFVDTVIDKYPNIDKDNICETGGSYGGFMTNWIIGHTDRFKACASQRSISNWLSFAGTSDIGYLFVKDQIKVKDPINEENILWDRSPLKYVNNAKTPTLFIHSDEDYRCPIEQGLQMMSGLIQNGVDSRMCYFHNENHELSRGGKPKNRIKRIEEITAWFNKYTKENKNV